MSEMSLRQCRAMQAEEIVNRLKQKSPLSVTRNSRTIRKTKPKSVNARESESIKSNPISECSGLPWYTDDHGEVRYVKFVLETEDSQSKESTPNNAESFSEIFKKLAMKFKSGAPQSVAGKTRVVKNEENGEVYIVGDKTNNQKLVLQPRLTPRPLLSDISRALDNIDFQSLKSESAISYLY